MPVEQLDAALFRRLIEAGAARLADGKEQVNALNVFPVPDGDTGNNMSMTMEAALRELATEQRDDSVGALAEAVARGSLLGARGNSGVILSQLFRGVARRLDGKRRAGAADLADALVEGVRAAYRAVGKPTEGTILTVSRECARAAVEAAQEGDLATTLSAALRAAEAALQRTPEQLPVLKKAGVVDSGGKGLCLIVEGFVKAAREAAGLTAGEPVAGAPAQPARTPARGEAAVTASRDRTPAKRVDFQVSEELGDIRYPYDTEFFIRSRSIDMTALRRQLEGMGDSQLVVGSPELTKVHIHTDNPGRVLDLALRHGVLLEIEIKNMAEQYEGVRAVARTNERRETAEAAPSRSVAPDAAARTAVVAVASGDGLARIFSSLGASRVVSGGQTMNPSTEDLLSAAEAAGSKAVILLPNNKNIVLSARAAAEVAAAKGISVAVVPTRSVPEGIAALLAWTPEAEPEAAEAAMAAAVGRVRAGEVTRAVRDSQVGDLRIRAGDALGLEAGEVVLAAPDLGDALSRLAARLLKGGGAVLTLYYGEGVAAEEAAAAADTLRRLHPGVEIEVHWGAQPLYPYLVSVE